MRHVGDAHLNPVVSVAMLMTRRASVIRCLLFIAAQFLGAIIGAGLAVAVTPSELRAGMQAQIHDIISPEQNASMLKCPPQCGSH